MKKMFIVFPIALLAIIGSYYWSTPLPSDSQNELMLTNVEALAASEAVVVVTCEGNTSICAKGVDENTGHEFHIHGKVTPQ